MYDKKIKGLRQEEKHDGWCQRARGREAGRQGAGRQGGCVMRKEYGFGSETVSPRYHSVI